MALPTNRTAASTIAEHTDDHNALATQHNELEGHATDTTDVHGITDTSVLETTIGSASKVATHAADTTDVHGIADTSALALTSHDHDADYEAAGTTATHAAVTTSVHGIADTSALALTTHDHDADYSATDHAHSGTYVPLPAGAPTSASQILGLSDDDPLTTDWIDAPSGGSQVAVGRAADTAAMFTIPGVAVTSVGTLGVTANRFLSTPILTQTTITLDQLAVEVSSAGSAGAAARLGIYNADANWQPTSLVLDAGTVATDSTGVKTVTVNQALTAGRYLLVVLASASATLRMFRGGTDLIGISPSLGSQPYVAEWRASVTYGALPDPGPALTAATTSANAYNCTVVCRVSTP